MQLKPLVQSIFRRWYLVAIATLLGLGAGAIVVLMTPSYYQTRTDVVLSTPGWNDVIAPQGDDAANVTGSLGTAFTLERAESYVRLAGSDDVLRTVAADTGYHGDARSLAAQVSVRVVPDTTIIEVSARSDTAAASEKLSQVMAAELGRAIEEVESGSVRSARSPVQATVITPVGVESPTVKVTAYEWLFYGTAIGLMVGVTLAVILEAGRRRVITSVDDAHEALGVPVLGKIVAERVVGHDGEIEATIVADTSALRLGGNVPGVLALAPVSEQTQTTVEPEVVDTIADSLAGPSTTPPLVETMTGSDRARVRSPEVRERLRSAAATQRVLLWANAIPAEPDILELALDLDAPVVLLITLETTRADETRSALRQLDDAGIQISGCILLEYHVAQRDALLRGSR